MNAREIIKRGLEFAHAEPLILIKWCLLSCFLFVLSVLFHSENFKLPKPGSRGVDPHLPYALSLARRRGWYALILFTLYILTVVAYDVTLVRKNRFISANLSASTPTPTITTPSPTPEVNGSAVSKEKESDVVSLYNDVTVFSEKNGATESIMDKMKQQYEPLLITYFILERCKMTDTNTFIALQDKILDELGRISGSAENLSKFIEASRGSYEEMYSTYDCSKADLAAMKSRLDANLQLHNAKPVNPQVSK